MLYYSEERSLKEDIKEGIEIALDAAGESAEQIDDIKVNKLVYLAALEFNIDLTYGWFKYGPAPVDVVRLGGQSGPSDDLYPRPAAEVPASGRSRVLSEQEDYPSPEAYAEWFASSDEFDRMLNTETKDYLEHFYDTYAPESYKSLYLACIRLQQHLVPIDRAQRGRRQMPVINDDYCDQLSSHLNDVYGELLRRPQLREAADSFNEYNRLLKSVMTSAASADGQLTEQQQRFIGEVVNFFFSDAWRYPALLISKDTVQGANSDRLRTSIESDLGEIRSDYPEALEDLRRRSEFHWLQPDAVRDVQEATDRRDDNAAETQHLTQWEKLAGEVINE